MIGDGPQLVRHRDVGARGEARRRLAAINQDPGTGARGRPTWLADSPGCRTPDPSFALVSRDGRARAAEASPPPTRARCRRWCRAEIRILLKRQTGCGIEQGGRATLPAVLPLEASLFLQCGCGLQRPPTRHLLPFLIGMQEARAAICQAVGTVVEGKCLSRTPTHRGLPRPVFPRRLATARAYPRQSARSRLCHRSRGV